jgi:UPF0755 protein
MFWRRKNNPDTPAAAPTPGGATPAAPAPKPGTLHTLKERQRNPAPRLPPTPPRVRPPRSRSAKHPMIVAANAVFTILALLAIGGGAAVWYGKYQLDAPGPLAQDRVVNIPRSGFRDVADVLEREGVIAQPWVFIAAVGLQKMRGVDLKSGEYQFTRQSSVQDVINTIVEGKVVQHQLTIPEGLTSEQIVQRLLDVDILSGNIREIPREGSLLPESYRFTRGTPREQVIRRMQEAQRKAVQEAWDRRAPDLPLKSPEELITLASIVEKETGKADERPRVAAVFANRLKQRIRLQSDPTIIYGLVGGKGTLGRPIQRNEITKPTPYNTYTIPGLPPGPIANPGRAAIEATANPAKTRELFFVADGTGGHAFSETLGEHQKNVGKLRAIERQPANDAADADDVAAQETSATPAAEPAARPKPAPAARPAARPAAPASAQAAPTNPPAQAPQRSRTQ